MRKPQLCLIVAVAENGVIGRDNQMPWHLPADLRHFKAITMGKPVVLGRKTFDSIGRPLPGRHFIVLTRDATWSAPGVDVVLSAEAALLRADEVAQQVGATEIMVAGGAELYTLFLDRADRIYRTLIPRAPEGDARFPELGQEWSVVDSQFEVDGGLQICFQTLEKCA